MLGSISEHGIRATDLRRKSEGYSGLSARSQTEDLSHGHSGKDLPQCTGPRQSDKRLAYLCRFRLRPHSESPTTMPTIAFITSGKVHDINILDNLSIEAGAIYIMDHGRRLQMLSPWEKTQKSTTK